MAVKCYRELIAWQKAMDLVELIYAITRHFPKEEQFGLTSQLRRAGVSIPSNIAEGQGRETTNDFRKFLTIARGSLHEAETQVRIAERLHYVTAEQTRAFHEQSDEVSRILRGLQHSLEQRS